MQKQSRLPHRQGGRQAGARRRGLQSCQSKAAKAKLQTTANILEVPVQPDILSARRCVALRSFILLLQQHSSHRALVLQLDDLMVLCLARGGEKQVIGPESRPGWPFSANPGMHGVTGCSLSGFDEGRWDTGTLGHWDGTSRRQCCRISLVPGCIQVPTSNLPRLPARLPRPKSPRARPPKAFLDSLHPSNTSLDPVRANPPLSVTSFCSRSFLHWSFSSSASSSASACASTSASTATSTPSPNATACRANITDIRIENESTLS
ncbi:hypothetical protein F5882DRAFT_97385 [Hyaloscypha sp. PMI_1271]|nr:hypothetical protein F5882DRAFT_97385 [Hyaloscypha sp. PMI_1271]